MVYSNTLRQKESEQSPGGAIPPRVSSSLKHRQLSRSKIELFLECPRCFYDDVAQNRHRPSGPPFTLNNAVDALLKAEFDLYRAAGTPHPIFASVGLEAIPLAHPQINQWRANRVGVRWKDAVTDWALYGAIDDAWETAAHTVLVADYKATARRDEVTEANLYPGYKRQVEVYQFLLEQQGLIVEPRAYFVYANGISSGRAFGGTLTFRTTLLPYDADHSWVLGTFRAAVSLIRNGARPVSADTCQWCQYVARTSEETTHPVALGRETPSYLKHVEEFGCSKFSG